MILRDRTNARPVGIWRPDGRLDSERLRPLVEQMAAKARVPGLSIVVTRGGGPMYVDAVGHADIGAPVAAAPTTRYLWFSMTKVVTATAVLRLADEARLDLDAPISQHLTWLPVRHDRVPTTRQLLTHTAGLTNPLPLRWVRPATEPPPNQTEFARRLLTRRVFARPPGERARYSNLGYLLAAEVITAVTGLPFTEYVEAAVLRPLGMTSTGFGAPTALAAVGYLNLPGPLPLLASAALPTAVRGRAPGPLRSLPPFLVNGAGYGGLVGPVTDAARFLRMHLNDGQLDGRRILATETARRMRTIVAAGRPFHHATGWFRKPTGTDTYVEHYGTGAGFWNLMRIYPEQNFGIVIMTNSTTSYQFHPLTTSIANRRSPGQP
jgi:CubicO group peptidase (beta-lactamase class C family)